MNNPKGIFLMKKQSQTSPDMATFIKGNNLDKATFPTWFIFFLKMKTNAAGKSGIAQVRERCACLWAVGLFS